MAGRTYIAIDLKSFYASVECVERQLNPLTTNLVVADKSRTEKTICLAVSPSLKAYGIPGRARLFEVVERTRQVNARRRQAAPGRSFRGKSVNALELQADPALELDYIVAVPRMQLYEDYSTRIYSIYLKYFAAEDIHVYSIDEVMIDATGYLSTYKMSAHDLTRKVIQDILSTTGITATGGIGTNLYLCKVAMDIVAKHVEADRDGVRIAELDQRKYRELLWDHRPLTDFWRVGPGYQRKLEASGLYTMGDIARFSLSSSGEEYLYKLFGINAELLIDHAWGWEPVTMPDIKGYQPENSSLGSGQVLQRPYSFEEARLVVKEMADALALDLVEKRLVTEQLELTVGYDSSNLTDPKIRANYHGPVTKDHYGKEVPKHAHGTIHIGYRTNSGKKIEASISELFDRVVGKNLLARRLNVVAVDVIPEAEADRDPTYEQFDLFTDYDAREAERKARKVAEKREADMQRAILAMKKKYGKNAVLKGRDFQEGATTRERNGQIGGHKA